MSNEIYKIFLEVAKFGSISKAAESLYISQPALSQKLKNLEEELESELFIRSNKGIELTELGEIVKKYFVISKDLLDEMKKEIVNKKNEISKIKIAATPLVCNYSLPTLMYSLKKYYPNLQIELCSKVDSNLVEQEIVKGRCDIGFISEEINDKHILETKSIYQEKIVLVGGTINNKYPNFIKKDELEKFELIKIKSDEDISKIISKKIEKFEKLNFLYNLESVDAIKNCLINGYGMAFLPYSLVKKEINYNELKIIEVENTKIIQKINLIKGNNSSKEFEKIIKYTENHIKKFVS